MARSMWRGAIQWGLVTIPIKLYLATESRSIGFNMLHETCLGRIQMRTWCPQEDEQISRSDTVRGFEFAKDQYVVVTDEDLASIPLPTVRSIEVERFVPATPADGEPPRYVKQAYYVEPEPVGRRAYALFRAVLAEKDLVAICKVVLKEREALASLGPQGSVLVLETLHWPDEIRASGELDIPDADVEVKPAELAMAEQLIAPMTGAFDPTAFRDEYRTALEELIAAKVEGREVVEAEEPAAGGGQLADLMAMLEASVKAATAATPAAARATTVKVASARSAGSAAAGKSTAKEAAAQEPAAEKAAAKASATKAAKGVPAPTARELAEREAAETKVRRRRSA